MKNRLFYLLILGIAFVGAFVFLSKPTKELDKPVLTNDAFPAVVHIKVFAPQPNEIISSPLKITGEARGSWYFEAQFPVYLYDANKNEVASGIAHAKGEWMTEDFVPFSATLTFSKLVTGSGTLVLAKDNPSGLAENDAKIEIPVRFESL